MIDLMRKASSGALILAMTASALVAEPAAAAPQARMAAPMAAPGVGEAWNHDDRGRHRGWERGRYGRHYDEPVYRDTRVWRGRDGRYYCRRSDGTTGLIIGAAAGALVGRGIAGDGDRTLGAILGGGAGALLGRQIERGGSRCR